MNIMDWTEQDVKDTLPKREADSHKGTFGTALLLAGAMTCQEPPFWPDWAR